MIVLVVLLNLVQYVLMCTFTALVFPITMLAFVLTGNPESSFRIGRVIWAPVCLRIGLSSVHVEGRENLPPVGQPYILMMNHASYLDILVAWVVCPTGLRFVAKAGLKYLPVVGQYMQAMGMVLIDRKNRHAAIASLRRAEQIVKSKGHVLAVFPEGTRTKDGTVGPLKKGVFFVAQKVGVPIVPLAMEGTARLMPRHFFPCYPTTLRARVGTPIATAGRKRDELMREVHGALIDLHVAIGGKGGDRSTPIAESEDKDG